jgi:hypothetical protein
MKSLQKILQFGESVHIQSSNGQSNQVMAQIKAFDNSLLSITKTYA